MTGVYSHETKAAIGATLNYLRLLAQAKHQGYKGAYTTDISWLIDMAINRRAGWLDDPTTTRGSCMPVNGRYPKAAGGDYGYNSLRLFARRVNTPRLIVRQRECPARYRHRLTHRFFEEE